MSERSGIVCGGNWIVDRVKTIDAYPREEKLANIRTESRRHGGCAFNVLVSLAKLGAPFPLSGIGLVGEDEDGDYVVALCRQFGIDASAIGRTAKAATSYTDVMSVADTGRRTFFHARGANSLLGPEHFDFSGLTAKHLHLGYLLLLDSLDNLDSACSTGAAEVLRAAKEAGLTTSIDLVSEASDRFRDLVPPALPFVDVCFMNEYELSQTTGISVLEDVGQEVVRKAVAALFDLGLTGAAVIHSARFAFSITHKGEESWVPCEQLEGIESTVGAGDSFAAGYLYGFHDSRNHSACLLLGVQAATSCLKGWQGWERKRRRLSSSSI